MLSLIDLPSKDSFTVFLADFFEDLKSFIFRFLLRRRYPNIILKKVLVFNYNFDSSSSTRLKQLTPGTLEIFPPDGDCEGGSMLDVHFTQVRFHEAIHDSFSIYLGLRKYANHCIVLMFL